MRRIMLMVPLFVALGATAKSETYTSRSTEKRIDAQGAYHNGHDDYYWETVERRVWVPSSRTRFGIDIRIIPGHYEVRREKVKVYRPRHDDYYYSKHPHGMPPGQYKKWEKHHKHHGHCRH